MKPAIELIEQRLTDALRKTAGREDVNPLLRPATDPRFGDYQANGVMALAKQLRTNPRQLAEQVVANLDVEDLCETPEVAGPGFINFRLSEPFIAARLLEINADPDRLAIEPTERPQTVVVDYSAPNIAKQMHVGHLRSTIIGDAAARMLEFLGHKVIRQNHIGDWGTQFGMLVQYLLDQLAAEHPDNPNQAIENFHIADLEDFYRQAKIRFDEDEAFRDAARERVVELHRRSSELTLRLWEQIVDESRRHYQPIYEMLGVTLAPEDERGESFYADKLADVVAELREKGIAVESEGAVCVFPDPEKFRNKEGDPLPFIVQKSDGAFLYATTDLAALRFRIRELGADHIIYVTDARQTQHFQMLFAAAALAGWTDHRVTLEHVSFGTMLGEDGRPFKTRTGGTVRLRDLLHEAVDRARGVVEEKNPDLPEDRKADIARAVGIGAVKYADYSNNRNSDYVFSFDRMLAMDGNTAPYMQYARARIKSIERKAATKGVDIEAELSAVTRLNLTADAELDLARHLVRYGEAIASAAADTRPNYLTAYLYDLAQKFSGFYNACPVLDADPDSRPTRLLLCDLTAQTIRHGLNQLLGIETVEQM